MSQLTAELLCWWCAGLMDECLQSSDYLYSPVMLPSGRIICSVGYGRGTLIKTFLPLPSSVTLQSEVLAGSKESDFADGDATKAAFNSVFGMVAVDSLRTIFICDNRNNRIRSLTGLPEEWFLPIGWKEAASSALMERTNLLKPLIEIVFSYLALSSK